MSSRILVAIRVAATPQHAFDVFTREIGLWWQATPLFRFTPRSPGTLAFEPCRGGRFVESFEDGTQFEIGRIVEWSPGTRLAFTWKQASFKADQETRVDVTFDAIGDETRITVEHRGWDSVPEDSVARHGFPDAVFLRRHGEWWQALLGALRSHIARRDP